LLRELDQFLLLRCGQVAGVNPTAPPMNEKITGPR
jgi:hypothetical protein